MNTTDGIGVMKVSFKLEISDQQPFTLLDNISDHTE